MLSTNDNLDPQHVDVLSGWELLEHSTGSSSKESSLLIKDPFDSPGVPNLFYLIV